MGSKGRGRVSSGSSQLAGEQLKTLVAGTGLHGAAMAVAGGGGLCSNVGAAMAADASGGVAEADGARTESRARSETASRATRGEGAARETPGEKQSSEQGKAGTAERAGVVDAGGDCQVLARFEVPVGQGSRSESSPPDSTIDRYRPMYQQLWCNCNCDGDCDTRLRAACGTLQEVERSGRGGTECAGADSEL